MGKLVADIWFSFMRAPLWVQIWTVLWLVPVNLAPLFFLDHTWGTLLACLSVGGMLLNVPIVLFDRGISKLMALPHILLWTPLVLVGLYLLTTGAESIGYATLLWVLVATNIISLMFDYTDFYRWLRGEREPL